MSVENRPGFGAVSRGRASVQAIETLADIRKGAREFATDGEQAVLRQFSGWGPLSDIFDRPTEAWTEMYERVSALLPADDVKVGMQGVYNAFYTPRAVTAAMWGLLEALGFTPGSRDNPVAVAELGCGTGAFMETAPTGVTVTGIERDPTAAAIAGLLNPTHRVIGERLEAVSLPGTFGAVIGNIPFGDVKVFDPSAPKDSAVTGALHNYFIWRALRSLAPGGLAVLLTSRFTMDARDAEVRRELLALGDFVTAIRLPSGGLEGGTEVVADIIVLRRTVPGNGRAGQDWLSVDDESFGYKNPVNAWWKRRPEMVLGKLVEGDTQQYGRGVLVDPVAGESAADGVRRVTPVIAKEARTAGLTWVKPIDPTAFDATRVVSKEGYLENSYHIDGKTMRVVVDGRLQPKPNASRELFALVGMRDLAERLVQAEADHSMPDTEVDKFRTPLRKAYDAYVRKFGFLNRSRIVADGEDEDGNPKFKRHRQPRGGFNHDPGAPLVDALEIWDDDSDSATPAPILSARQNRPIVRPQHTDDPREALSWSLDRLGRVDLEHIARWLRADVGEEDEIANVLGDAVFQEPGHETWLTGEEYLSGDVRAKLRAAETAAIVDAKWQRNVDALNRVLPKWLGPGEIKAVLGAPWIPTSDVEQFIEDLLGGGATVRRFRESNRWEVEGGFRHSTKSAEEWGTPHVDAYKLIENGLNGKTPEVRKRVGKDKTVKDEAASLQAAEALQRIKERFSVWVWEDGFRADRLVEHYNTHFNCLVTRRYDGSHITVDGLAPDWAAKLYPHQKEFIARALATPATLCGHPVGAGKTATMTCSAMKLKQVGMVDKPMLVVPNHLLGQADAAARQMFPAARIFSSALESKSSGKSEGGTTVKTRRAFAARVTTQPWDLIIITQSAFDRLPVSPLVEEEYLEGRKAALHLALVEGDPEGKKKGRQAKALAKKLDNLEVEIRELRQRAYGPDGGCTFEQLGVRWIGLDEAHNYANLAVPCYNEGFQISASKRATHLDMILRWLAGQGSGRYCALFTGTPIKNTMLQLYVMQQYLMPEYLDSIGLGSADAWVSTYVEMETKVGVTVNGGEFEMQTKPARFVNAPELRVQFSMVADIRTAEQLGLWRPEVARRTVKVQPTRKQQAYAEDLVSRAKALKGVRFPEPGGDNMLRICTEGRWMATDPRLVGLHDNEPGKLGAVAEDMIRLWREYPDELQIGFCDIGTPNDKAGAQTYGRLAAQLVDMGMPRNRIRFVHEAKSMAEKNDLFRACNAGKVSVILGSTSKLGTGTNIQERVIAMHNIDAPYTPAEVEQRFGRGARPGNRNKLIHDIVYVTARTFDAYLWGLLVRKLGFISQMMSGNLDREIEDCASEQLINFAAVQAAATDQPLLLERAEVEAQVNRLRTMQAGHRQMQQRQRQHIPLLREKIAEKRAEQKAWAAVAAAPTPELDEDAAKKLGEELHHAMEQARTYHTFVVKHGGLDIRFGWWLTAASEQREPQMRVDGGDGWVAANLYSSYKPDTLVKRLLDLVAKADATAEPYANLISGLETELADKEALLTADFDQQGELTSKLARLDQIDAQLRQEALRSEMGEGAVIIGDGDESEDDPGAGYHHGGEDLTDEQRQLVAEIEAGATADIRHPLADAPMSPALAAEVLRIIDEHEPTVPDTIPDEVVADVQARTPEVVQSAESMMAAFLADMTPEPEPATQPEPETEDDPLAFMNDVFGDLMDDYRAKFENDLADALSMLGVN